MIRAKKSLGQNFLKDKKTLTLIANKAFDIDLPVLEVGPGKGALTAVLLEHGLKVLAVEKDHRLQELLQEKFAEQIAAGQFTLLEGDVLENKPEDLGFADQEFQVVANLPYYITGLYLRKTLEHHVRPAAITLMLQKEAVDRIVARDGKESLLSVSVKAFGVPSKLCNVAAKHFSPAPKVDSAVLHIAGISDALFVEYGVTNDDFFTVAKAGFSSRRKMLKNNLHNLIKMHPVSYAEMCAAIQKNETVRPENLDITDWFALTRIILKD